jgi:phosphatidate cytidylyltransferase
LISKKDKDGLENEMRREKNPDLGIRTLINGGSALLIALFIFIAHDLVFRWIFASAVAAIAAIAVWEYDRLVKQKGMSPAVSLSVISVILYIFAAFIKTQGPYQHFPSLWANGPEIILAMAFFGCFVYFAIVGKPPISHIATSFFGIIYVGVPLGLFVRVMYFFTFGGNSDPYLEGSWWIIFLLAVTKSADIGGYFVGSYFGKRKLALKLSPNKTLEGALGGLLVSICVSLLICYLGKNYGEVFKKFTYTQALGVGALIGILGQIGDLAESFLKRDAAVKDSNTIPGVGGILDMIDSLLFTAPVVYIFLRIIYT